MSRQVLAHGKIGTVDGTGAETCDTRAVRCLSAACLPLFIGELLAGRRDELPAVNADREDVEGSISPYVDFREGMLPLRRSSLNVGEVVVAQAADGNGFDGLVREPEHGLGGQLNRMDVTVDQVDAVLVKVLGGVVLVRVRAVRCVQLPHLVKFTMRVAFHPLHSSLREAKRMLDFDEALDFRMPIDPSVHSPFVVPLEHDELGTRVFDSNGVRDLVQQFVGNVVLVLETPAFLRPPLAFVVSVDSVGIDVVAQLDEFVDVLRRRVMENGANCFGVVVRSVDVRKNEDSFDCHTLSPAYAEQEDYS